MSRRKLVSIGGWCGPALILGKLGLRTQSYPFDFSRCTMDGVTTFVGHGFDEGFFPPGPPPFRPECVGIWVLFRGQHTAFAHFDLNDPKIQEAFERKIARWDQLLDNKETTNNGVTFFRTITARHPQEEFPWIEKFQDAVRRRNPQLDFRTVVVVHDQKIQKKSTDKKEEKDDENDMMGEAAITRRIEPLNETTQCWLLEYTESEEKTLFDRSQEGYATIVAHSLDERNWEIEAMRRDILSAKRMEGKFASLSTFFKEEEEEMGHNGGMMILPRSLIPWRAHTNLALIDGIASVGGTCQGIGSTLMQPSNTATLQSLHYSAMTQAETEGQKEEEVESKGEKDDVDVSEEPAAESPASTSSNQPSSQQPPNTDSLKLPSCHYCGNRNFHKAGRPFRSNRPFTMEEDELLLIHLYRILTGGDKVEAVEQLAHEMNRGAFEVICRIQFLTSSSTKITDGLELD